MKKMVKNFIGWFVVFGLSFLVQKLGWAEQGKAFLFIDLIYFGFLIILSLMIASAGRRVSLVAKVSVIAVISTAIGIGISLFATWGASELFDIDFYIVYQIMSFGKCLVVQTEKNK